VAERKRFFLKKEAKTFASLNTHYGTSNSHEQKFFGSFFQKRTACCLALFPTEHSLRQTPTRISNRYLATSLIKCAAR
jgi:hypothetical protein